MSKRATFKEHELRSAIGNLDVYDRKKRAYELYIEDGQVKRRVKKQFIRDANKHMTLTIS